MAIDYIYLLHHTTAVPIMPIQWIKVLHRHETYFSLIYKQSLQSLQRRRPLNKGVCNGAIHVSINGVKWIQLEETTQTESLGQRR